MGYSNDEGRVRIDFFKSSGKWYTTEDLMMDGFYFGSEANCPPNHTPRLLPDAIIAAMRASPGRFRMDDGRMRYSGMWAVVLEPYHEHAHPQMFRVPDRFDDK